VRPAGLIGFAGVYADRAERDDAALSDAFAQSLLSIGRTDGSRLLTMPP
jgi:hypothetical protein